MKTPGRIIRCRGADRSADGKNRILGQHGCQCQLPDTDAAVPEELSSCCLLRAVHLLIRLAGLSRSGWIRILSTQLTKIRSRSSRIRSVHSLDLLFLLWSKRGCHGMIRLHIPRRTLNIHNGMWPKTVRVAIFQQGKEKGARGIGAKHPERGSGTMHPIKLKIVK